MEIPIELIPLNCIGCGTPIPAQMDEIAWVCAQCGQGQQLGQDGLLPLQVFYAQENAPDQKGKPYWVCEGRVTLKRSTYGDAEKDEEAQQFWAQPRAFFIPAFPCSIQTIDKEGVARLQNPPELHPGPVVPFEPATISADDLHAFVEFLIIAFEAEREDALQKIEFDLILSEPELWILPPS